MIYTMTFNPALDYIVHVDHFEPGLTNRSYDEDIQFGGKGINVSYVLNQLGFDSIALGYVAGFTGQELLRGIESMGVKSQMIQLKQGHTRINVKLKSNEESEINGSGPFIDQDEIDAMYHQLDTLQNNDVLVLSGSIPQSLPATIYQDMMAYLKEKDILFVVDATKDLLLNVLQYHPFLIKPNHYELAEMLNVKIENDDDIVKYAKVLQEKGARNVLISMDKDGAILVDENGDVTKIGVPKGQVKNSVGAGDSMLAGFIAGYLRGYDYGTTLKLATACGSATAFSENLATQKEIEDLFEKLK